MLQCFFKFSVTYILLDKGKGKDLPHINDFKKGYQPRTIIVKDEKGDLVADSHSIMTRWRNYFSQLLKSLNVHMLK